jgi:purine-cytosine permease-like protein
MIHTVSTFGAAKSYPQRIAANWSQFMRHDSPSMKFFIFLIMGVCVLFLVMNVRSMFRGR